MSYTVHFYQPSQREKVSLLTMLFKLTAERCSLKKIFFEGQKEEERQQQGKPPAPQPLKSGVKFVVKAWQLSMFYFQCLHLHKGCFPLKGCLGFWECAHVKTMSALTFRSSICLPIYPHFTTYILIELPLKSTSETTLLNSIHTLSKLLIRSCGS